MAAEFVIVARVRRAHGTAGELVVELLTDAPDVLLAPGSRLVAGTSRGDVAAPRVDLRVTAASPFKGGLIVRVDGIGDRDTADRWRDRYLLVPAEEVPAPGPDEMYIHDLPGYRVRSEQGEDLGTVTVFYEMAQGLMLEVTKDDKDFLLPYREAFVRHVDREAKVIVVDLPEGFFG